MTHSLAPAASSEAQESDTNSSAVVETLLWDRKVEGGFPETKELKNRVRNIVEPGRDLGHIDRSLKKQQQQREEQRRGPGGGATVAESRTEPEFKKDSGVITMAQGADAEGNAAAKTECEDCK